MDQNKGWESVFQVESVTPAQGLSQARGEAQRREEEEVVFRIAGLHRESLSPEMGSTL